MKIAKMIAVKTETLVEEQEMLRLFPNAYWREGSGDDEYATFYVSESHILTIKESFGL
jgi:hypothetical protein